MSFTEKEYATRLKTVCDSLRKAGWDGLLMFRQESMYWLTGYDSFGFCFFQCLVLSADGKHTLLTRAPDLRQAQNTSNIQDIRIWQDQKDATPEIMLKDILHEFGLAGKNLGIEYDAYGLNGLWTMRLNAMLEGFASSGDASGLVSALRVVKSPQEMAYIRQAAELSDRAWIKALEVAGGGVDESVVLAAMQAEVFLGGGDYPGNEFIIGSGQNALLCRYYSGRRVMDVEDQLTLEWSGVYRHYHAAQMRTLPIGRARNEHRRMHAACHEALLSCAETLRPGVPLGKVFDVHARVMDDHGYQHARMNACGYSMGATFSPTWMDAPMIYHGNDFVVQENHVFFMHMILMDSETQIAMNLGDSYWVTSAAAERLGQQSLELVTR